GLLEATRQAMYRVQQDILRDVGPERLARAGEQGVLRLMLRYDPLFFALLELPELLALVDAALSPTAILHLPNGFLLPHTPQALGRPEVFQYRFHTDFPRVLNGYLASLNVMFAIDAFTAENGGTLLVPGTHQKPTPPELSYMQAHAIPVECPPGS